MAKARKYSPQCRKPGHSPYHYLGFETTWSQNYDFHVGASGSEAVQDCYKRQPKPLCSHPLLSPHSSLEPGEWEEAPLLLLFLLLLLQLLQE